MTLSDLTFQDLKLKLQLLESSLTENQMRVTKYEEAIGVKDQVQKNVPALTAVKNLK